MVDFPELTFVDEDRQKDFLKLIGGDVGFLIRITEVFQQDMREKMAILRAATRQGDTVTARLQAANMKSSGAMMGTGRLSELCEKMEILIAAGSADMGDLFSLVSLIEDEFIRVQKLMKDCIHHINDWQQVSATNPTDK